MENAKCGCPTDGEFIFHNRYCAKKIDCCEKVCPSCARFYKELTAVNAENDSLRARLALLEKVAEAAQGTILVYDMDQVEFMLLPDPMGMIRAALDAAKEGK